MTAPTDPVVQTHIDLDQVEDTPWACGPYTRRALVAAARALLAVVEAEDLARFAADELTEPWASALAAVQPFRPEAVAS